MKLFLARTRMTAIISLFFLLAYSSAAAVEISGVKLPEKATLANNITVKLNGAGIRTKFFFDIYIGALYVENTSHSAQALVSSIGANRMLMHFLYDGVSKEKITAGWVDGFQDNNSEKQMKELQSELNSFNTFFSDTKKGDVILLDYIPHTGTEIRINGKLMGAIPGERFNQALRKVWLGDDPVDSGLKEALLGVTEE